MQAKSIAATPVEFHFLKAWMSRDYLQTFIWCNLYCLGRGREDIVSLFNSVLWALVDSDVKILHQPLKGNTALKCSRVLIIIN